MKAIIKNIGEKPAVVEIENTIAALQEVVGGYIENIKVGDNLYMLCNEEGRLQGLKYNFDLGNTLIVGNVLFVQFKGADFTDIDESNIEAIMKFFNKTPYTT